MHRLVRLATFAFAMFCASGAYAGPYTDDLSKCLVKATTADDQTVFMQWIFSSISLHPAVSGLTSITDDQRAAFQKKAAKLFVRLLSADCRQQTTDAAKYEGKIAMQASFQLYGQAAMRGLMGNPQVAEGMQTLAKYFQHDENWIALLRDAGLSPASSSQ